MAPLGNGVHDNGPMLSVQGCDWPAIMLLQYTLLPDLDLLTS